MFLLLILNIFHTFFSVPIVDFEQVNVSWDTAKRPDKFVKVYLNNYLTDQEHEDCIEKSDSEVVVMKVQGSNKDIETNTCSIFIPSNFCLSQTANLPAKLKLSVGVRVMFIDNINVLDRLINASVSTVEHLDIKSKPLCSIIYMKFDDARAGNFLKDRRLRGELKECVLITLTTKKFPSKKGKSTFIDERKQFPVILGLAITVHKS